MVNRWVPPAMLRKGTAMRRYGSAELVNRWLPPAMLGKAAATRRWKLEHAESE